MSSDIHHKRLQIDPDSKLPAYRRVVDAVLEAIQNRELKPGERLPGRITMAESLNVSATTIRHAYEKLEELGVIAAKHGSGTYVLPDALQQAGSLNLRQFGTIAVVIGSPRLVDRTREEVYLTSEILYGLEQAIGSQAERIVCVESFTHACLAQLPADSAVLIKQTNAVELSLLDELAERGIPVLGLWGSANTVPIPTVHYDVHQAPALACQHLIDCGYERIGFIGAKSSTNESPMGMKFFEFTNVLHSSGMDYKASHVWDVLYDSGRAYRAATQMVESGDLPDAVFVDTDIKAMEVINAFTDCSLRVPDDIGVVGYDDLPEAAKFNPPLTTVRTPRREIGKKAGELLLHWSDQTKPRKHIVLESELIVRETTLASGVDSSRSSLVGSEKH